MYEVFSYSLCELDTIQNIGQRLISFLLQQEIGFKVALNPTF